MADFMLRTDTEDQMLDALIAAGLAKELIDEEGEVVVLPMEGVTLDHIGQIKADTRWHTNLRTAFELSGETVAMLPTVDPFPENPYRVFL